MMEAFKIIKLIEGFFNSEYKIYLHYEFYDIDGNFIEKSDFLKNLSKSKSFKFIHKYSGTSMVMINMCVEDYLNNFNETILFGSKYNAIDMCIFTDNKLDNNRFICQIKLTYK